jgi:hypothetical protein
MINLGSGLRAFRRVVEIALERRVSRVQIGLQRGLVARQQGNTRRQQTQLQVLAHKVALVGRDQHRVGVVDAAHLHEARQLLGDARRERLPPHLPARLSGSRRHLRAISRRSGMRYGVRGDRFAVERQRVDLVDRVVELDGEARQIGGRRRLQLVDVLCNRLAHRQRLGTVRRSQTRVGTLQREQRELRITRQFQLLARAREHLRHFGEGPVVAIAREVGVLLLQRLLGLLRIGQLAFELRHLRIDPMHGRHRLVGLHGECSGLRVVGLLALGQLLIETDDLAIERNAAGHGCTSNDHDDKPQQRSARTAARLLRFVGREGGIGRQRCGRSRLG